MLTCSTVRTKYSWLNIRFQTLWPKRVTTLWHLCQSTLSKPHQIQWVWIHFCCSSNSFLLGTDVLRYELCVYPPALFEATGSMLQSDKPSQAKAIQGWVHPSSTQFPQDVSYIFDGGALIIKIPWKTYGSLCGRYIEYAKKIWLTKVFSVCWLPMWSFYKKAILIWDGRNHLAVTLPNQKRQPRYTT